MRTYRGVFALALIGLLAVESASAREIELVVDVSLPPVAHSALQELQRTLGVKGWTVRIVAAPTTDAPQAIIGLTGKSPTVDRWLKAEGIQLPDAAESMAVRRIGEARKTLLIAGRDARGLAYALRDVARSVELSPPSAEPFASAIEEVAAPGLAVRNVSIHLFNADVERSWYFDEAFWRYYFRQLALNRFNQFTLTFSDQTNYLCPLYAFLVDLPEYPSVKVIDSAVEKPPRQLAMLRRITELAAEHGLEFNLGIWMQSPVPRYSAPVQVTGLPEGLPLADYCALGLRRLLAACPEIRGVQLRMNAEAGVAEEQQTEFFRPIFAAISEAGRPIRLELRYKGLQAATIQAAIEKKLDVTVSTKFWAEHFGLPYHPTSVDTHWREDRYSFGAMLAEPRNYRVVYQLWNVGSQRLTTWGDPDYARRFAASCRLGGGEGFEVFAPLTDQGYGNRPGAWRAIADGIYQVGRWDQERYWFFYLCFGRLGYSGDTSPEVWKREFRARFAAAAESVEQAYRAASQVLPFITAVRLPGASEWSWWPEMDTGGSLREYMHIQPSDPMQFYSIRSWRRTEGWRWEDWDDTPGFVEDVLANRVTGKWTPWMMADHLDALAAAIELYWRAAEEHHLATSEWRITTVDHRLLADLARYHAAKLRAATELAFFERDEQPGRLTLAERHLGKARTAWRHMAETTDRVYHRDLVFGVSKDSPRSTLGHHHTGHWRDRIGDDSNPELSIFTVHQRVVAFPPEVRRLPLEMAESPPPFRPIFGLRTTWQFDGGLDVRMAVKSFHGLREVKLYYRPVDQTKDWHAMSMTRNETGFSALIPADQIDSRFELQCFVELLGERAGQRWPDWDPGPPYVVVSRARQ